FESSVYLSVSAPLVVVSSLLLFPLFRVLYFVVRVLIEFRVPGSTTTDLRMPGETIPCIFCISFALV
ncbi:hypothetical protein ECPA5_2939, partial [Escherichia coli PA5]